MDGTTLVIAIIGLVTTASSPVILSWRTARNQESARLRDLRTQLYTDATVYAQALLSTVGRLTDPYGRGSPRLSDVPLADRITARIRLLASEPVVKAWTELIAADEALRWTVNEEFPGIGMGQAVPVDHPAVAAVEPLIQKFYSATRHASLRGDAEIRKHD